MPGTNTEVRENLAKYLESIRNDEALQTLEGFDRFIKAMEELNDISDNYYQMNKKGQMTYLTRESYQKLISAYEAAEQACTEFLQSQVAEGMKHPAQVVHEMLELDMKHLGTLSFENGAVISLPMALDRARGYSVNVDGDVKSVGGALSSRMKLSVINSRGKTINGYFTEDSTLDYPRDFRSALQHLAEVMESCCAKTTVLKEKNLLLWTADLLREELQTNKISGNEKLITFLEPGQMHALWRELGLKPNKVSDLYSLADKKSFEDYPEVLKKELSAFEDKLNSIYTQYIMYHEHLRISDGANISRRNCALSTLANMLGAPDIVAASVPMEIQKGGVSKKGVFMENAKGKSFTKLSYGAPVGQCSLDDLITPEARKKLATLQILDYLGSNIDRHCFNMSYVFDEQGRIVDVQGYDNDCSFSPVEFSDKRKIVQLAALAEITVIPRDVADSIKTMTPEMLRHTLRGNLTDDEINAACRRLESLRSRLKEGAKRSFYQSGRNKGKLKLVSGTISVIEPDEWKNLTAKDLSKMSDREWDELERPADLARYPRINPARMRGNGLSCKNIFGTVLLLPATQRYLNVINEDEKMLEEAGKEDATDEEKKTVLKDSDLREKIRGNLVKGARDSDAGAFLKDEFRDFADAEQAQPIPGITAENDWNTVQNELTQLLTTNYVGGKAQYQALKKAMQEFTAAEAETVHTGNVLEYEKKMQDLYRCADAYLVYKKNPSNRRERLRVEVAGRIKTFAKERLDILKPYAEPEHQREIYSTLDMTTGMARMIDRIDGRRQQHENAGPEEAYLAAYQKMALEGLNTLIGLSQDKFIPAEKENLALRALAKMVTAELAESDFLRKDEAASQMAQHSQTPEEREKIVNDLGKNFLFSHIMGLITPEKLQRLCSDPRAIRDLMEKITELRKKDAAVNRQKEKDLAPVQAEENIAPVQSGPFSFLKY